MKRSLLIKSFPAVFWLAASLSASAAPLFNLDCGDGVVLSCNGQTTFNSNFALGGIPDTEPAECIVYNANYDLHEFWFKLELSGAINYFLDGNGVNAGLEVYTGGCKNLQLLSCNPAQGNNTYLSFYGLPDGDYFVRALGYDFAGGSNFQMVLNCFNPVPVCDLSINSIEIAPCINDQGMVEIQVSGVADGNLNMDYVYCEMETDADYYIFDGTKTGNAWSLTAEVQGAEIYYISVGCGNSENYCQDALESIPLPTIVCGGIGNGDLVGSVNWNAACSDKMANVKLYEPGTALLKAQYNVSIENNGHFLIENPLSGTYDMLLKVDGALAKGFQDVTIQTGINNMINCGTLKRGEITGDNFINLADLSVINSWFNKIVPPGTNFTFLDFNCDGVITLVDLSVVNASFGMVGDTVPLN